MLLGGHQMGANHASTTLWSRSDTERARKFACECGGAQEQFMHRTCQGQWFKPTGGHIFDQAQTHNPSRSWCVAST